MRLVESLKIPAVALSTVVALGACGIGNGAKDVAAKLTSVYEGYPQDSDKRITLPRETPVDADCIVTGAPFVLEVEVASGRYEGERIHVPRSFLEATSDPYGANKVGQDPFGPLPWCDI